MTVPLQPVPAQVQTMNLSSQRVRIAVRERHRYDTLPSADSAVRSVVPVRAADGSVSVYDPGADVVRVKLPALYMDVSVSDAVVVAGVLCRNWVRVVRGRYLGLAGDFAFWDTQGSADPLSAGLGSRWLLFYVQPSELA
jgi:hypothetical protein